MLDTDNGDLLLDADLRHFCLRAREGGWAQRLSIGVERMVYLLRDGHGGVLLLDTPEHGAWGWRYTSWHEAGFLLARLLVVLDADGWNVCMERGPAYHLSLEHV